MVFYFEFCGKTIKVEVNWLDGNLWHMARTSGMGLGFYEIKICQFFI